MKIVNHGYTYVTSKLLVCPECSEKSVDWERASDRTSYGSDSVIFRFKCRHCGCIWVEEEKAHDLTEQEKVMLLMQGMFGKRPYFSEITLWKDGDWRVKVSSSRTRKSGKIRRISLDYHKLDNRYILTIVDSKLFPEPGPIRENPSYYDTLFYSKDITNLIK